MGKIDTFTDFMKEALRYLDMATEALTEEQLDWKSCPEANTIRSILGHLLVEWHGDLPKLLSGDEVLSDEDVSVLKERALAHGYTGVEGKSVEEIRVDLTEGKKYLLAELDRLEDEDLTKEVEWFKGKQSIGKYLMIFIAEIFHHEGQITAILGVEKRIMAL